MYAYIYIIYGWIPGFKVTFWKCWSPIVGDSRISRGWCFSIPKKGTEWTATMYLLSLSTIFSVVDCLDQQILHFTSRPQEIPSLDPCRTKTPKPLWTQIPVVFWGSPGLLSEAEEIFKDVLEHCREALGVPWCKPPVWWSLWFPFDEVVGVVENRNPIFKAKWRWCTYFLTSLLTIVFCGDCHNMIL